MIVDRARDEPVMCHMPIRFSMNLDAGLALADYPISGDIVVSYHTQRCCWVCEAVAMDLHLV